MKSRKLAGCVALLLLCGAVAHAQGNGAGNGGRGGGKGALCVDADGKQTYRLLDYLRAEGPEWGKMTLVKPTGADEYAMAKDLADRVYDYSPMIRAKLHQAIEHFRNNHVIFTDYDFSYVPDSNEVGVPNNCSRPVMIVKQKFPQNSQEKLYHVNATVWNSPLFSLEEKAGTIIHEVVLADIRIRDPKILSDQASFFNAYISSTLMKTGGSEGWERLLRDTNLYRLSNEVFGREDLSIKLMAENATTLNQELPVSISRGYMSSHFNWHDLDLGGGLYGNGMDPTAIKVNGVDVLLAGTGKIRFNRDTKLITAVEFGFSPNATNPDTELERLVTVQGQAITAVLKGTVLAYDAKGLVTRAAFKTSATFKDGGGRELTVPAGTAVYFLEGKLLHVGLVRDVNAGKHMKNVTHIVCDDRIRQDDYYHGGGVRKLEISAGYDTDESIYSVLLKRSESDSKEWVSFSTMTPPTLDPFNGPEAREILNASFDDLVKTRINKKVTSECAIAIPYYWFWSVCVLSLPKIYQPDDRYRGVEAGSLVLKATKLPPKGSREDFVLDVSHNALTRDGGLHANGSVSGKFRCHWR